MNKKSLFLIVLALTFVQCFCFAQLKTTGGDGAVTATLLSHSADKERNGCMLENTSSNPVEVTYTIKFIKQFVSSSASSDKQEVTKNGTIILAPVGTSKVKGKPTARYWITAGEGLPVVFSETTVDLIVKRTNSY